MLARVMIACPVRGQPIDTELEASPRTWSVLIVQPRTLVCAACGGRHRWTKADAWLAEPRQPAADASLLG